MEEIVWKRGDGPNGSVRVAERLRGSGAENCGANEDSEGRLNCLFWDIIIGLAEKVVCCDLVAVLSSGVRGATRITSGLAHNG